MSIELLAVLGLFLSLVALDLAALLFGADSRRLVPLDPHQAPRRDI